METAQFHRLQVADVTRDGAGSIVRLAVPPHLGATFSFRPGQHVTLRRWDGELDVRRCYSLCNSPGEPDLQIGVKPIRGGSLSPWLADLKPGTEVEVLPPRGGVAFAFDPEAALHYVGLAGGSGVTPIHAILSHALAAEPGSRATLVYGVRSLAEMMLNDRLFALKNRHIHRFNLLAVPEEHYGRLGDLDLAALGRALGFSARPEERFVICGPAEMADKCNAAVSALGALPQNVSREYFTAPNVADTVRHEPPDCIQDGRLEIVIDGRPWTLDYDASKGSILDNLLAAGAPAPFACRTAVCGACRARLRSGEVEVRRSYALRPEELSRGDVLLCQSYPRTSRVRIEI